MLYSNRRKSNVSFYHAILLVLLLSSSVLWSGFALACDFTIVGSNSTVSENEGPAKVRIQHNCLVDGDIPPPIAGSSYRISYGFLDISATNGSDYLGNPATIDFKTSDPNFLDVVIPIDDDNVVESDETFDMAITNSLQCFSGGGCDDLVGIDNGRHRVAILNDDFGRVQLALASEAVSIDEDAGTATLVVERAGLARVRAVVSTFPDSAQPNVDYTFGTPTLLEWMAGETGTKNITVPIIDNLVEEGTEQFTVELSNGGIGTVGPRVLSTLTIIDDDFGRVQLAQSSEFVTVNEDAGTATLVVERAGMARVRAVVSTFPDSAQPNDDYTFGTPTLIEWVAGETGTKNITVPIIDDFLTEDPEKFTVELSTGGIGTVGPRLVSTLTITDDDTPGEVEFGGIIDLTESEGNTATLTLVRTGNGPVSVDVSAVGNVPNSATPGIDFASATPATVAWAAGETGDKNVSIALLSDVDEEVTENVLVEIQLTSGSEGSLGNSNIGKIAILDTTEPGTLIVNGAGVTTTEGASPTISFFVSRVGGTDGPVSADFSTINGTAISPSDFESSTGTLNWGDGDDSNRQVTITIVDDSIVENNGENFTIQLDNALPWGNAVLLGNPSSFPVTINDDDSVAGVVEFASTGFSVNEDDGTVTLTLNRSGNEAIDVEFFVNEGSATDPEDFANISSSFLSWGANESGSKSITFDITNDSTAELQESFSVDVDLGSGSNGSIGGNNVATVTINDDDNVAGVVEFASTGFSVNEDDGTVTLTLDRSGNEAIEVAFSASDGTATNPDDYGVLSPSSLSWAANEEGSKDITIEITNDTIAEPQENFFVDVFLASGSGGAIGSNQTATVTINDDDNVAAAVEFTAPSSNVDENAGSVTVSVIRTGTDPISVDVTTNESLPVSAILGQDFNPATPNPLVWEMNEIEPKTISVPIIDDQNVEGPETFELALSISSGSGGTVLDRSNHTVTINDTTTPGTLQFSVATLSVAESTGGSFATVTVTRTGGSDGPLTAQFATADDTAIQGVDYNGVADTLTWTDGDDSDRTFDISILDDSLLESDKQFFVNLFSDDPLGTPVQLAITIVDDDAVAAVVQFASARATVDENAETLVVELIRSGTEQISVDITTSESIPLSAELGSDFNAGTPTSLSWQNNEMGSKFVTVPILDNTVLEPAETFDLLLSLTSGSTGSIGTNSAVSATIEDDDNLAAVVEFESTATTVNEADGTAILTLNRTGNEAIDVEFIVSDGSATNPDDYGNLSTSFLSWAANEEGSKNITVNINNDLVAEPVESFSVEVFLSSASNGSIGTNSIASVAINDDDNVAAVVDFSAASTTVNENDGTVTLTLNRTGNEAINVEFNASDGTANNPDDYSNISTSFLSWEANEEGSKSITFDITDDLLAETQENFSVEVILGSGSGGSIGTTSIVNILINDDDNVAGVVEFASTITNVSEADGTAVLTLNRSGNEAMDVEFIVTDGTALNPDDYGNLSTSFLSWAVNEQGSKNITVNITNDLLAEPQESFSIEVTLGSINGGSIGTNAITTITINDDDNLAAMVDFASDNAIVNEADGTLTLTLNRTGNEAIDVVLTTNEGTATSPADFNNLTPNLLGWVANESGSKDITIDITNDVTAEISEVFSVDVSLVSGSGGSIGTNSTVIVTVEDDDNIPATVEFAAVATNVDENAGSATLTVNRAGTDPIAVDVTTSESNPVSASLGQDFNAAAPAQLIWAMNETGPKTISIPIIDDQLVEGAETFDAALSISSGSGGSVLDNNINTVTINDTTAPGTLQFSVAALSVAETTGGSVATITVTRTGGSDGAVSVQYDSTSGTAIEDVDYTAVSGVLNWADGDDTDRTFDVAILDDSLQEADKQFIVTLTSSDPLGSPTQLTVTIVDDDAVAATVQFAATTATVGENEGNLTVELIRAGTEEISVDVTTTETIPASALLGSDFNTGTPLSLSWATNEMGSKFFTVPILDDTLLESSEFFDVLLSLTSGSGGSIGTNSSLSATIEDDDALAAVVEFDSATSIVNEADGTIVLTLNRSGNEAIDVGFLVNDGTATNPQDYGNISTTFLSWAANESGSKNITINITDDAIAEVPEDFSVEVFLQSGSSGTIGINAITTVTISDDDNVTAVVDFASPSFNVNEAEGTISVTLNRSGTDPVSVGFFVSDGTASLIDDYNNLSPTTLIWVMNETGSKDITFDITDDLIAENLETFDIEVGLLSGSLGSIGAQPATTVAITDDDNVEASVEFASTTANVDEDAEIVTVTINRTGTDPIAVDVTALESIPVSAAFGVDFGAATPNTLSWEMNESGSKTITVPIINDTSVEAAETFDVGLVLASGSGGSVGVNDTTTVTIDDTSTPGTLQFTVPSITVAEAAGGSTVMIGVSRTGGSDGALSTQFSTSDGSALAGADYTGVTGTINWSDGDTLDKFIAISILDDVLEELDKTFFIDLASDDELGIPSQLEVTIVDNDAIEAVVQFASATATINENEGTLSLELVRSGTAEIVVGITTSESSPASAEFGTDFDSAAPVSLGWATNEMGNKSVSIPIINNNLLEQSETFEVSLTLLDGSNSSIGTNDNVTVTIEDDDAITAEINFTETALTVNETDGTVALTLDRSGNEAITVEFFVNDGSATSPDDYNNLAPTTISWVENEPGSKDVTVDIINDPNAEADEDFSVEVGVVSGSGGAIGSDSVSVITIIDDDNVPAVVEFAEIASSTSEDAGILSIMVNRSGTDAIAVDVLALEIAPASALSGQDFGAVSPVALTWAMNETGSKTVTIPILDDLILEEDELFQIVLSLSAGSAGSIGENGVHSVAITDTTAPGILQFTDNAFVISETPGGSSLTALVARTGGSDGVVSVEFATDNRSALAGTDYDAAGGVLSWADGDTEDKVVTVPLLDDFLAEGDELFVIDLFNAMPFGDDQQIGAIDQLTVTVLDDEIPGSVEFTLDSITINENDGILTLDLVRTGNEAVSVDISTTDGSATFGSDFLSASPAIVNWAANETGVKSISIPVSEDTLIETVETFTINLQLSDGSAGSIGSTDQVTVSIIDSTSPGTLQFTAPGATVTESDAGTIVTAMVSRTGGTDGALSVQFDTIDGNATAGNDYLSDTGTLQWTDGDDQPKPISVTILNDNTVEPPQQFSIMLSNNMPSNTLNPLGTPASFAVNINDDDVAGSVEFAATTLTTEENSSSGNIVVDLQRTGNTPVTVIVATQNGSAVAPADYISLATTVSWEGGEQGNRQVLIPVLADDIEEPSESFTVNLSLSAGSTGAIGNNNQLTVTVNDSTERGIAQFVNATNNAAEGAVPISLVVEREGGTDGPASVSFTTVSDSAIAELDFEAVNGTLTWADGDDSAKTIIVNLLDDNENEDDEQFFVDLSPGVADDAIALGQPSRFTVNINSNTETVAGSVQLADNTITVNESTGLADITLVRSGDEPVNVIVNTIDGTAMAGRDYQAVSTEVSWDLFETGSKTVSIAITNDTLFEPDENFEVQLTTGTAGTLGANSSAVITIIDETNPGVLQFTTSMLETTEDAGQIELAVERVQGFEGMVSVNFTTANASASAGTDYTAISGTLEWQNGDATNRTITIPILNDNEVENSENFVVILSQAQPIGDSVQLGSPTEISVVIEESLSDAGMLQFADSTSNTTETRLEPLLVEVERIDGAEGTVSIDYVGVSGSAISGVDFEPVEGTLEWLSGDTASKTIQVFLLDDGVLENSEDFHIDLVQAFPLGNDLQLGNPVRHTIRIESDLVQAGLLQFTESDIRIDENSETFSVTVERISGNEGEVSVNLNLTAGTAQDGIDFLVPQTSTLFWAAGDSDPKTISIELVNDDVPEESEQFSISLGMASPLGDDTQLGDITELTVTITDGDTPAESPESQPGQIRLISSEFRVTERKRRVEIVAERFGGNAGDVSAVFDIQSVTALLGADFDLPDSVQFNWLSGQQGLRSVSIPITLDALFDETEESFQVSLISSQPAGLIDPTANEAAVVILNSNPANDTVNPFRFVALALEEQSAVIGQVISGMSFQVMDTREADSPAPSIRVRWTAIPEGSVEFLNGTPDAQGFITTTDGTGRTDNAVRILSSDGVIRIVAEALIDATNAVSIVNRMNEIPEFPVFQGQGLYTIRVGIGEIPDLSPSQDAAGDGLDSACSVLRELGTQEGNTDDNATVDTEASIDLVNTCSILEEQIENSSDPAADLDRIAPEEVHALADSVVETANLQLTNVYSRINAIRSGNAERFDLGGLSLNLLDETIPGSVVNAVQNSLYTLANPAFQGGGGSASADNTSFSRFGFFANGSISVGEIQGGLSDGSGQQQSGDIKTSGLTVGVDYRYSDSLVFGTGLGFAQNETSFTTTLGGSSAEAFNLTLFGTWYNNDIGYADLVLDVGLNNYDVERQINLIQDDDNPVMARGQTDAVVSSLTFAAGRNFNYSDWEFGPYGRFTYTNGTINGYSETASDRTAGFGSVLDIESHRVTSSTLSLGGQASKTINTRKAVFVPQIRFEYEVESESSKEGVTASFQADPENTQFTLQGNRRDTSYLNLGIGTSAVLPNGKSGFIFYETRALQDNVTQHWLKLGVRLQF